MLANADFVHVAMLLVAVLGLFGLSCAILVSDCTRRTIHNEHCAAIALLSLAWWYAQDEWDLERLALQSAVLLIAFLPLLLLHTASAIGGGDVKLMLALMLWVSPAQVLPMIAIIVLTGGLLGICVLLLCAVGGGRAGTCARPSVPYGVAIVAGGWVLLAPRFVALASFAS